MPIHSHEPLTITRASFARARYDAYYSGYYSSVRHALREAQEPQEQPTLFNARCCECQTLVQIDALTHYAASDDPHNTRAYCGVCIAAGVAIGRPFAQACRACDKRYLRSTMIRLGPDHYGALCIPCAVTCVENARKPFVPVRAIFQESFVTYVSREYNRLYDYPTCYDTAYDAERTKITDAFHHAINTFPRVAHNARVVYENELDSAGRIYRAFDLCDGCNSLREKHTVKAYDMLDWDNAPCDETEHLCTACARERYATCDGCRETVRRDSDVFEDWHSDAMRAVCDGCYDNEYLTCMFCDCITHMDNARETPNADWACDECWSERYFYCEGCDSTVRRRYYCCDGYCSECCTCRTDNDEDDDGLDSYSTDVCYKTGVYPVEGQLAFGMELEYESAQGSSPYNIAQEARARSQSLIVKSDGSLSNGAEIVTAPLPLAQQREVLSALLREDLKPARVANSTGIHIHASLSAMTNSQLARLILFFGAKHNAPFLNAIACRNLVGHSYAALHERSWKSILCKYDGRNAYRCLSDTNRYQALNITSKGTAEFRLFRSTKTHDLAQAHLDFVAALIAFCRLPLSLQEAQRAQAFCAFVQRERKVYPYLAKRLTLAKFNAWTNAQATEENEEDCAVA